MSTFKDLWQEAFNGLQHSQQNIELFLSTQAAADNAMINKILTPLQNKVFQQCLDANDQGDINLHPFYTPRNILIGGPTSCGKTAIAEVFLLLPMLQYKQHKPAIYLAPTRALAQMKFNELKRRFGQCRNLLTGKLLNDDIIISTGEDGLDDDRLAAGNFTVACIVNEKANVLFSEQIDILDKIGALVIDELHMLDDIHRGPVLEMLITKVLHHKTNSQQHNQLIKLICLSTENMGDPSLTNFLSTLASHQVHRPLLIIDQFRPVPIEHHLILPPSDRQKKFSTLFIEKFQSARLSSISENKKLSLLTDMEQIIDQYNANHRDKEREFCKKREITELKNRTFKLLKSLLRSQTQCYRLLIFQSSKVACHDMARHLKNGFIASGFQPWSLMDESVFRQVLIEFNEAEEDIPALIEFASYGIFIHHADIDRGVRHFIEQYFSSPDSGKKKTSAVIIATTTLSYGVNLAVHDVVLPLNNYPVTKRNGSMSTAPLSICNFHNMIGRAGRLGLFDDKETANVYLLPESSQKLTVLDYYQTIPSIKSKLLLECDTETLAYKYQQYYDELQQQETTTDSEQAIRTLVNARLCEERQFISNDVYSFSFTRSVLDALRHLTSEHSSARLGNYASVKQITNLLKSTLYYAQSGLHEDPFQQDIFDHSIHMVLEHCVNTQILLVDQLPNSEQYRIAELGKSIINTGTEVNTISGIISHTNAIDEIWQRYYPQDQFPLEFYILIVIMQKEVLIQQKNPPELLHKPKVWKKGNRIQDNREQVSTLFYDNLIDILAKENIDYKIRELTLDIIAYLDEQLLNVGIGCGYPCGLTDAVLRLFCGALAWINIQPIKVIKQIVQMGKSIPPTENPKRQLSNFHRFTDTISWKLGVILEISRFSQKSPEFVLPPLSSAKRVKMLSLCKQIRIGCDARGIPLFYPSSSNYLRRRVISMLRQSGVTATRILSSSNSTKGLISGISKEKISKDIVNFVTNQLNHLYKTLNAQGLLAQTTLFSSMGQFWLLQIELLKPGIEAFSASQFTNLNFSAHLKNHFCNDNNVTATAIDSVPNDQKHSVTLPTKIIIETCGQGMIWKSKAISNSQGQAQIQTQVKVIGIQLTQGWFVYAEESPDYQSLELLLATETKTPHLVLVCLPWVPYLVETPDPIREQLISRKKNGYSTTFISFAAFSSQITLTNAGYFSPDSMLKQWCSPHPGLLRLTLVNNLLDNWPQGYNNKELPNSIYAAIANYYEAGKDYDYYLNEYPHHKFKNRTMDNIHQALTSVLLSQESTITPPAKEL